MISPSISLPFRAGVAGWPISHSLSPQLHGFWLAQYGIEGSYDAFAVPPEELANFIRSLREKGLRGVNLTVPLKEAVIPLLDRCDEAASRIGAVNLVTVDADGVLSGSNTDAYGFRQNLAVAGVKVQGGKAVMLGAGGAARAVLFALIEMGFAAVHIVNRSLERAEKLAEQFATPTCRLSCGDWAGAAQTLEGAALLVNTSSLGMKGQADLDLPLDALPATAVVTDIVYAPLETMLLRRARERGLPTVDGLGMLLHQARPSFAAFFGRDPEVTEALRGHVLAARKET